MFRQTEHQVQRPWGRRKLGWLQGHPGGGGSEGSCRKGKPVGAALVTRGTLACSEQEGLCSALGSGMTQGGSHNSLAEQWLRVEVVRNGQTRDMWEGRAQDLLMLNVGFGKRWEPRMTLTLEFGLSNWKSIVVIFCIWEDWGGDLWAGDI